MLIVPMPRFNEVRKRLTRDTQFTSPMLRFMQSQQKYQSFSMVRMAISADGAILVPLTLLREGAGDAQFAEVLAQRVPKKAIIYLYCRSGKRCLAAGQILSQLGYETRPLKHGFVDLAREGFVTAKPKM